MKGITITRRVIPPVSGTRAGDVLGVALLIAMGIVVVPLLYLALLMVWLRDRVFPSKSAPSDAVPEWHTIDTGTYLTLRYQHLHAATISAEAEGYFENEVVLRYQADPEMPFFDGFFTSFRVKRIDGLFLQKIHFDDSLTEVVAMPLYFFNYQTRQAEELLDLQDFELDTKGNPDDFIIEAIGEHETLHVHLVRK